MFNLLISLLVALAIGCSTGGGSASPADNLKLLDADDGKPLTAQHKKQLTDLSLELQVLDKAGRAAETGQSIGVPKGDEMKKLLRDNNCFIDIANPKIPEGSYDVTYKFNIDGQNCPVEQIAESRVQNRLQENLETQHYVSYRVKDAQYEALGDVKELHYVDKAQVSYSFSGQIIAARGKGAGTGQLISKTLGAIDITTESAVAMNASNGGLSGGAEAVTRLKFNDFVAVVRVKQVVEGREVRLKYYLNGAEITQDFYLQLVRHLSLTDANRSAPVTGF